MTIETKRTIYKRTSTGAVQIWYGELDRDNGRYRTSSGQQSGKITTSEWTQCQPKNVGRANATSAGEQAECELEAMYEKRLAREYHESIEHRYESDSSSRCSPTSGEIGRIRYQQTL
jgi:hypothetical protein